MSSKSEILKSIKNASLEEVRRDDESFTLTTYEDKLKAFKESIKGVAGKFIECDESEIPFKIEEIFGKDKKIASNIKECSAKNVELESIKSPKELKDIDIAIVKGEFGVSENGAIYINDKNLKDRALLFITKTLVILLDKDALVNNMQEAYKKIPNDANFGVFISGPSKTADIEQSLVIGAHGAVELFVLLY